MMKIKINGFELIKGSGITLEEFFNYLFVNSGVTFNNNIFALSKNNNEFYQGLFLTIRNAKTFCKMQKEGKSFKITHQELSDGENIVHFNFFIINKTTYRGIYQQYYGSSSLNKFNLFLSDRYKELKNSKISEEKSKLDAKISKEQTQKIQKKYQKELSYSIMERRESFQERINSLKKVKSFKFDYMTLSSNDTELQPLSDFANRISHEVIFSQPTNGVFSSIKNAIINSLKSKNLSKYQVKGIDANDAEIVYKSANDFDVFAEYDYDDITRTVNIDSNNLIESIDKSHLIKELLNIAQLDNIKPLLTMKAK